MKPQTACGVIDVTRRQVAIGATAVRRHGYDVRVLGDKAVLAVVGSRYDVSCRIQPQSLISALVIRKVDHLAARLCDTSQTPGGVCVAGFVVTAIETCPHGANLRDVAPRVVVEVGHPVLRIDHPGLPGIRVAIAGHPPQRIDRVSDLVSIANLGVSERDLSSIALRYGRNPVTGAIVGVERLKHLSVGNRVVLWRQIHDHGRKAALVVVAVANSRLYKLYAILDRHRTNLGQILASVVIKRDPTASIRYASQLPVGTVRECPRIAANVSGRQNPARTASFIAFSAPRSPVLPDVLTRGRVHRQVVIRVHTFGRVVRAHAGVVIEDFL
ncbi:hypothetical protein D3C85_476690 [compost metagenome]